MGGLAAARVAVDEATPAQAPRCTLGRAWTGFDDADRAELLAWLRDPALTSVAISGYLVAAGVRITDHMVARHRPHYTPGATCRCPVAAAARS